MPRAAATTTTTTTAALATLALVAVAVVLAQPALASSAPAPAPGPSSSSCTASTTNDQGPDASRNKPCVFPFTYDKGTSYSSCVAFSEKQPVLNSVPAPPPGAYWCATSSNYNPRDKQKSKLWGFCTCQTGGGGGGNEYEGAGGGGEYEGAPPTSTSASSAPSSPPTSASTPTSTSTYTTSGGYVPESATCVFPLTFNDGASYSSCVPMSEKQPQYKGKGGKGQKPVDPTNADKTGWCFAPPPTFAPPATGVNYDLLPKEMAVNWGYCRSTSGSGSGSGSSAPSAAPTGTVTNGGYVINGTACRLPFTYVKSNGKQLTYSACAPFGLPSMPFVNAGNPPAQPTPPNTNATWCYVGTGLYDPSDKSKRGLWGFCANATAMATSAPSATSGTSGAPTAAPVAATAPPSATNSTGTPPPSVAASPAPSSAAPTSTAPTTATTTTAPSATGTTNATQPTMSTGAPSAAATTPTTTTSTQGTRSPTMPQPANQGNTTTSGAAATRSSAALAVAALGAAVAALGVW